MVHCQTRPLRRARPCALRARSSPPLCSRQPDSPHLSTPTSFPCPLSLAGTPTDVWSLGITALEMAESRPPYSEVNPTIRALFLITSHPPVLDRPVRIPRNKARRRRWQLDESCWAARKEQTGGNFFETSEAVHAMFMADWQVAVRSHELGWYILKCHHDPTTWRSLDRHNEHGGSDEVDQVKVVLWQYEYHRLVYGAFEYYSVIYSEGEVAPGEPDVYNMTLNAYMK